MAMSGMITFVFLVILIDYLNGQNIPTHPERVVFKATGKAARIKCIVDSSTLKSNALHWYRAQSGGAFQRLMYFEAGQSKPTNDKDVPTGYGGSVKTEIVNNTQLVSLTISKLVLQDAGSYFCALWTDGNYRIKRFGTGTRLIVTEPKGDTVIPPKVSAYLPSRKKSGKQAMLCQARDMFPDLVTFTWKKKSNTGDWTDVSKDDVVEQSNSENSKVTSVTSMVIVDENTAGDNLYKCIPKHEGGKDHEGIELKKDNKESAKKSNEPDPTCPPDTDDTEKTGENQISGNSEQMPSLYLFVYAYGVMLMKNGLYFCAISIFLLKGKFGKKE